jgi:hypothetical protein
MGNFKPKPFRRDRVETVSTAQVKRSWQDVPITHLGIDDVVQYNFKITDIYWNILRADSLYERAVEIQAIITYLSGDTEALVGWLSEDIAGPTPTKYAGTTGHAYTTATGHPDPLRVDPLHG